MIKAQHDQRAGPASLARLVPLIIRIYSKERAPSKVRENCCRILNREFVCAGSVMLAAMGKKKNNFYRLDTNLCVTMSSERGDASCNKDYQTIIATLFDMPRQSISETRANAALLARSVPDDAPVMQVITHLRTPLSRFVIFQYALVKRKGEF